MPLSDPQAPDEKVTIPASYQAFNPGADAQRVITVKQLSAWLRLPELECEAMASRSEIPAKRIGGEWRFGVVAVNRWLEGLPPERDNAARLETLTEALQSVMSRLAALLPPPPKGSVSAEAGLVTFDIIDPPTLDAIESAYIAYILGRTDGNKTTAAELLGIDPSTLYRKLSRFKEQGGEAG